MIEFGDVLGRAFFDRDVHEVARELLGCAVVRHAADGVAAGRIVEVEAYGGAPDKACHADRGTPTSRTETMFGPAGHAYVYRIYGMYDCLNVVTARGPNDEASAVLIRALEPLSGIELAKTRRRQDAVKALMSGPGKICQALAISRQLDGHALWDQPLQLHIGESPAAIDASERIGLNPKTVGAAAKYLWRYTEAGSRYLSR